MENKNNWYRDSVCVSINPLLKKKIYLWGEAGTGSLVSSSQWAPLSSEAVNYEAEKRHAMSESYIKDFPEDVKKLIVPMCLWRQ